MRIGLDLDDTINCICKTFPIYAEKFNKEENINYIMKPDVWDFTIAYGWDENAIIKFQNKYIFKVFSDAKVKEDAKMYIDKLKSEGHEIVIITARHESNQDNVQEVTKKWLKENKIPYDELAITGEYKAKVAKDLKIDVFVDDRLQYCEEIKNELGIPVLMVDSIYNKQDNNENIPRVFNWEDIYNEINKINK